jgi:hypothetical protein
MNLLDYIFVGMRVVIGEETDIRVTAAPIVAAISTANDP